MAHQTFIWQFATPLTFEGAVGDLKQSAAVILRSIIGVGIFKLQ